MATDYDMTERQRAIVEDFRLFEDDWEGKYQYIIEQGDRIPLIEPSFKTDAYLIPGCLSRVWLRAEQSDGRVLYKADSESALVRGLAALLIRVLSEQSPQDILNADLSFIEETGLLKEHFTLQRKNGLQSLLKRMKLYALAFAETASP